MLLSTIKKVDYAIQPCFFNKNVGGSCYPVTIITTVVQNNER